MSEVSVYRGLALGLEQVLGPWAEDEERYSLVEGLGYPQASGGS